MEAQREWIASKHQRLPFDEMMAALEAHKASEEWQKDEGQYIPRPYAYLSGHRWRDRLKPAKKRKPEPASPVVLPAPKGWKEYLAEAGIRQVDRFADLPEYLQKKIRRELKQGIPAAA